MSNLMKMPHEISLWDDVLTVVDSDGNEYSGFVDVDKITVAAQYYKEKKLCVISSDKLESPTFVVDPALVRKTDGTSTLTFSIYAKYWDEGRGELVDNPFVQYLTNERKVKLKYYPNGELKWLDFIIKKVDESSENYKFTYTATDLFINELSKSGYNLEFDMELENNQGPIDVLADMVLEGTDWTVGVDSELLQQTVTEALYEITLTKNIQARDIFTEKEKTIYAGQKIYTFYSVIANKVYKYFQFIYNANGIYTADENGVLYNAGNYYAILDENALPYDTYEYKNDYRGERFVRSPKTVYDKVLGRYVNTYNNDQIYGYVEDKYISPALVSNLITNGSHITANTGWFQQKTMELKAEMLPTYKETSSYDVERFFGLEFVKDSKNAFVGNSGFKDNLSKIEKIAENDSFIFRIKGGKPVQTNGITTGLDMRTGYFGVEVSAYKINEDDGAILKIPGTTIFSGWATQRDSEEYYYTDEMKVSRAVSFEELNDVTSKRYGIFITTNENDNTYYIQEAELFATIKDEKGRIILPSGKLLIGNKVLSDEPQAYVDKTYYYYNPNSETNKKATTVLQMEYEYIGKRALETYIPTYVPQFEKIRGITAKETNRFNLLQSLSETFECWCRFDILHKENGEIALGRDVSQTFLDPGGVEENGLFYTAGDPLSTEALFIIANAVQTTADSYRQQKFVTFHEKIGQKKDIGFAYGINLKSVSRSLDSNDIATKLIVKNNNNKYANIGSCSIARANENPNGENFVLDFSHYIRQGLLNYKNVQNDLYSQDSDRGWIGLYYRLKNLNNDRDQLVVKQSALAAELSRHKSDFESSRLLYDSTNEEYREQIIYYHKLTQHEYGTIEQKLKDLEGDESEDAKKKRTDLQGWLDNQKVIATAINIESLEVEQKKHKQVYENAEKSLKKIEEDLTSIEVQLQEIKNQSTALINKFEKKYSRFLQEASWISEDYTDDNLYYFDAESTLHNAAQPKVSYTVNMVELSQLEGYEEYNFDLGDITYVQDPDFFGWVIDEGIKTPYKEEIVITEMATYFNSPEKNTIKAKNYRDSFEDLFQRLAASSQQLQFHSGSYDRAADAVGSDGNIMPQALEDAFAHNAFVLSNIANQSVKWDEYGITTTDTTDPADIVRITSGGIYLTEDGGRNWTTGISASGINAKTITTGQLDTGAVTIMSGNQTAFRWDDNGINAFKEVPDGEGGYKRSSQTYVRFDEHGLYGIDGQANFDPKKPNDNNSTGIDKINEEAKFALTWDGFVLNSNKPNDDTPTVRISDVNDFQILDKNGEERLKIGRLMGQNSVGLRTSVDGNNEVVIGDTGFKDAQTKEEGGHGKVVFKAGPPPKYNPETQNYEDASSLRIYEDGYLYVQNSQIGGTLSPAQMRALSVSVTYSNKVDGTSAILSCEPVILSDEIDNIQWKIGEAILSTEAVLELGYDELKEYTPDKDGDYVITALAKISEEGDEDDNSSNADYHGTVKINAKAIFKTETSYGISDSSTKHPESWQSDLPLFEPGKYCWMKVSNIYPTGEEGARYEVTYFGKDGADAHDLNLKASSLVFIKDKAGNISPEEIYFEAVLQNYIGEGSFNWVGANAQNDGDSISNTAILTKDDFGDSKVRTVSVDYGDLHDEVTIALLDDGKDGESAITVILSNPAMTFDVNIADQEEETQAYVYFGTTEIKDFTLTPDDSGVDVDGSKIKVRNPGYSTTKQVLLSATINGKTYEQIIPIKCLVTDTGYRVELTNDSASIGVDSNGAYDKDSLELISKTSVEVYFGSQNISKDCTYYWEANGGALYTDTGKTTYFTSLDSTSVTATATATIIYDGKTIGEKTFTITKVYAGAAVSFKLNTSFTSVNSKQTPKVVTLQVLKIIGSQADDITEELGQSFEIKADNVALSSKFYSISQTTTFTLEIGETIWDTETVAVVHDGQDGGKGDKGNKGDKGDKGDKGTKTEAVRIYYRTKATSAAKPTSGETIYTYAINNYWTTNAVTPNSTYPHVFSCTGTKTTTYSSSTDTTGTSKYNNDWTEPELYLAYGGAGVDTIQYAQFLKLTNFGTMKTIYQNENQLFINADFIQTGALTVKNTANQEIIFSAGWNAGGKGVVELAGWEATDSGLRYNSMGETTSMCLVPKGEQCQAAIGGLSDGEWCFTVSNNFGVTTSGDLYCSTANLGDFRVTSRTISFDVTETDNVAVNYPSLEMHYDYFGSAHIYRNRLDPGILALQYIYQTGGTGPTNRVFKYANESVLAPSSLEFYYYTTKPDSTLDKTATQRGMFIKTDWGTSQLSDRLVLGSTLFITPYSKSVSWENQANRIYTSPSTLHFMFAKDGGWADAGYFSTYSSGYVNIIGTFRTNGNNWISSSDLKVKKDIQNFTDNYDVLFDNLVPRLYRFKDGTSGRLHSGYIVQEVLEAMNNSSISTQDFAAVCAFGDPEDKTTEWGFRYDEMAALNTWQIQKLKPRMTAAEQEIKTLKLEIERLRAELENLK